MSKNGGGGNDTCNELSLVPASDPEGPTRNPALCFSFTRKGIVTLLSSLPRCDRAYQRLGTSPVLSTPVVLSKTQQPDAKCCAMPPRILF